MKSFTKKGFLQKMIISICIVIMTSSFVVPHYSQADVGGVLLSPFVDLICTIGDLAINLVQTCLGGSFSTDHSWSFNSFMIADNEYASKASTLSGPKGDAFKTITMKIDKGEDDELTRGWLGMSNRYYIPVIQYSPEQIFAGEVPGLDINFMNPNFSEAEHGLAATLQKVIASWYVALRNLATVGLLCVLAYVGIRMILSSTAGDKAKFKQMFMDWLIAICILFVLHYIMSFTITVVDAVTDAISAGGKNNITVSVQTSESTPNTFKTNLLGLARFKTQYDDVGKKLTYLVMYMFLVYYTIYFTVIYLKRALTLAFLTIIAPIVAFTYPIDKLNDGKAQAFNSWLKEYIYNVLIQPFHMILYYVLVTSAMELASTNIIYAIVAIWFIPQAEKLLRKFFGFDSKAPSLGNAMTGMALGAAASNAIGNAKKLIGGVSSGGSKGGSSDGKGTSKDSTGSVRYKKSPDLPVMESSAGENGSKGLPSGQDTGNVGIDEDRRQQIQEQFEEGQDGRIGTKVDDYNPQLADNGNKDNGGMQDEIKTKNEEEKKFRISNLTRARAGGQERRIKGYAKMGRAVFKAAGTVGGATIGMIAGAATGRGIDGMIAGMAGGAAAGRALGGKASSMVGKVGMPVARVADSTIGAGVKNLKSGYKATGTVGGALEYANGKAALAAKKSIRDQVANSRLGKTLDTAYGDNKYAKIATRNAFRADENNREYIQRMLTKESNGRQASQDQVDDYMESLDSYADEGFSIQDAVKAHEIAKNMGISDEYAAKAVTWKEGQNGFKGSDIKKDEDVDKLLERVEKQYISSGLSQSDAKKNSSKMVEFGLAMEGQQYKFAKHKAYNPRPVGQRANTQPSAANNSEATEPVKKGRGRPPKMRNGATTPSPAPQTSKPTPRPRTPRTK